MRPLYRILFFTCLVFSSQSTLGADTADAIYHNGTILTINDAEPTAEAVAIKDGRVIAVGTLDEVLKTTGDNTKKIDIGGKTMLPGFVDSHGHAYMIGLQASTANLLPPPDGTGKDIASLQALLTDWAANNKEAVEKIGWIAGFGYDDSQLAEQRHPTRDDLDKVSKDLPIIIIHQSGHLGVANSKALEIAGETANTEDPKGGVFRRKEGSQEPTEYWRSMPSSSSSANWHPILMIPPMTPWWRKAPSSQLPLGTRLLKRGGRWAPALRP